MSVFSSHPQTSYRSLIGLVAIVAVLAGGSIYFGGILRGSLTATQLDAIATSSPTVEATETVFPEPTAFDEEGVVKAILAGGQGIALQLANRKGFVQVYTADGSAVPITEGTVRVRGVLTEISCAYVNTLFEGQCTPAVTLESITSVPVRLVQ